MSESQMHLFSLTDEEWRERSKRLAAMVQDYKQTEERRNTLVKDMNKSLKGLRKDIEQLAEAVSQGKEWRTLLDDPPEWDR